MGKCVQKKELTMGKEKTKKLVKMIEAAEELKKNKGQDSEQDKIELLMKDKIELEVANTLANTNKKFVDPDSMETNEKAKSFSTKSLKDEHGNYPVWMSMRRVQKQQKKNKAVASAAKSAKKKAH